MKLRNILKVLDMMDWNADVYVRFNDGEYIPLRDLRISDIGDNFSNIDKKYTLNLDDVEDSIDENFYPKMYVQLTEDFNL